MVAAAAVVLDQSSSLNISTSDPATSSTTRRGHDITCLQSSAFTDISSLSSEFFGGGSTITKRSNRHSPRRHSSHRAIEELTINKLRLSNVGFYGREQELATLQACLEDKQDNNDHQHHRELVLIRGFSGCGKTTLARSLIPNVQSKGGIFVEGKFDLTAVESDALSGFLSVCRHLCQEIATSSKHPEDLILTIRQKLHEQLEEQTLQILTSVLPESILILGEDKEEDSDDSGMMMMLGEKEERGNVSSSAESTASTEAQSQQLKYIFRVFIRVVSSSLPGPLVMFLDDLQWAQESLDLISTLLLDTENRNRLLIVGCYRSNEVDDHDGGNHPLSRMVQDLEQKKDFVTTTTMDINNLTVEDTNAIIMDLLSTDDSNRTMGLARICHQRTLGNAYFLIQFVAMLHEQQLLEFNLGLLQWCWDESDIANSTSVSPNVVSLVRTRMEKSPLSLRQFLKVLACLGGGQMPPSERVIRVAWGENNDNDKFAAVTSGDMIQAAMEANYIEECGERETTTSYRFVHDKILEASLSLMEEEKERNELRFCIGERLLKGLSEEEIESEVFLIADLLDARVVDNGCSDLSMIVDLTLMAAEKAKSLSAFSSALKYAEKGVELLQLSPDSSCCWENQYDTTLRLYSVGAESAGSVGNVDALEKISQVVLAREDVPTLDKLRVYNALLDSMASNGKLLEAASLVRELLNKLGCRVPNPTPLQAVRTIMTLLKLKRKPISKESIVKLPKMTDVKKVECVRLLYQLQTFSFLNRDVPTFLYCVTKMVRLTMRFGLMDLSASCFAALGVPMVALFNDFQTGAMYSSYGQLILTLGPYKISEARVAFTCVVGPSYFQPMQSFIKGLNESYKTGMQMGDTDSAMWCIGHSCWLQFMTGKPLAEVEAECRLSLSRMKALNRNEAVHFTSPVWQATLNLMGLSPFTTSLAGEAFGLQDEQAVWDLDVTGAGPLRPHIEISKTMLLTYFGGYEAGADLFIKRGDRYLKDHPAHPQGNMDSFLKGVCLFAAAQKTNKRKYRRHAYKARATIAFWWKRGNPNSQHQVSFLDAEHYALNKKWIDAGLCYQKAITLASRCGLTHDAALASERYAACLIQQGEMGDASFRIRKSIQLYKEWGAMAVVGSIESRYREVLASGSQPFD